MFMDLLIINPIMTFPCMELISTVTNNFVLRFLTYILGWVILNFYEIGLKKLFRQ